MGAFKLCLICMPSALGPAALGQSGIHIRQSPHAHALQLFHAFLYDNRFTEVLEIAEDIEIDVPNIWQYLAEIVVPVIKDGTISLDILTKAPSSVIESGKAALLLAEVLKLSEKIMVSYL